MSAVIKPLRSGGCLLLCLLGAVAVVHADDGGALTQRPLSTDALRLAKQFASGTGRLRILYFGNSRVYGTSGFGLAGCMLHTKERGLLVGTGFINPSWKVANHGEIVPHITSTGQSVERCTEAVQLNTPAAHGACLRPGQQITTGAVLSARPISSADDLVFTVVYRRGPTEGTLQLTPLAGPDADSLKPVASAVKTVLATAPGDPRAAYVRVTIRGDSSGKLARALKITAVNGHNHIYDLHAWTTARSGYVVGRIGSSGHGFPFQMRTAKGKNPRCARQDYITNLESFDPDVAVLMFAANQQYTVARWVKAAQELIARLREARRGKSLLVILQLENPSPFVHSKSMARHSVRYLQRLHDLEPDCLLVSPNSNLPADWPTAGDEQPSKYYRDPVHETDLGYQEIWRALFKDFKARVDQMPAPPSLTELSQPPAARTPQANLAPSKTTEPGSSGCSVCASTSLAPPPLMLMLGGVLLAWRRRW